MRGGDVEAAGLALEFHETAAARAEVEKHFGEQILQVAVMDCACGIQAMEARIREIEGRAELMCRRVGGVHVHPA